MLWWFILACDLLIPLLMIILGGAMHKQPPKKINNLVGYRTPRSMKNEDTWKYSHEYIGRLWTKLGWIVFALSVLVHIPFYNSSENVVGVLAVVIEMLQCAIMVASVVATEKALKSKFTDDGKLK